jgi:hypothetical protein
MRRRAGAAIALFAAAGGVALAVSLSAPGSGRHRASSAAQAGPRKVHHTVTLTVLNGTGRAGEAAGVAARLTKAGFRVRKVGDAQTSVAATKVTYRAGQRGTADAVATALQISLAAVHPVAAGAADTADVVVLVGPDLRP